MGERSLPSWYNAVAESFFHTLKTELTHHYKFKDREEAKYVIFEYIEVFYNRIYLVMDVFSRKIVGWQIHGYESADLAADLMVDICAHEGILKHQVTLHSDNGSPMKGATMLATLQKLGVMPSFSRPAVSNDNPYSESIFKTLKYHHKYPCKQFQSLGNARDWVESFVSWYNYKHLHSAISFVTPDQRHSGEDIEILKNRHNVYLKAKSLNPNRWSKQTRNWQHISSVSLNPDKSTREKQMEIAA